MNPRSDLTDTLPPHDLNAERAALGCALDGTPEGARLAPEFRPDWFYDLRHRQVAETLTALAAENKPIEPATVYQRLAAAGFPEATLLLADCASAAPSPAGFSYWRDILLEKLTRRRIIRTAQEAIADAYLPDRPTLSCLDDFERAALAIRRQTSAGEDGEVDLKATLDEMTREYDQAYHDKQPRGLTTGFNELDQIIGGLKPQQLFILAARPSIGKTSLALGVAGNLALNQGRSVGFFSLEMAGRELLHRLACARAGVDGARLNTGAAEDPEMKAVGAAQARIARAPLHINDRGGLTLAQLTARARRLVQAHGIQILFVDYLGLIRSGERGRSRYEETTLVSNGLKTLAKELNLPVVALAQLNRESDHEGRAPGLYDLRDSGAIEQDADIVALLHRNTEQPTAKTQTISVIVAKHRTGRTGTVNLIFNRALTRFEESNAKAKF